MLFFMFLPCSLFISPKSHFSFFELFLHVFFYLFEYLLIFLGLIVVLKSNFVHNNIMKKFKFCCLDLIFLTWVLFKNLSEEKKNNIRVCLKAQF